MERQTTAPAPASALFHGRGHGRRAVGGRSMAPSAGHGTAQRSTQRSTQPRAPAPSKTRRGTQRGEPKVKVPGTPRDVPLQHHSLSDPPKHTQTQAHTHAGSHAPT